MFALSLVALAGCGGSPEERATEIQSELSSFSCDWEKTGDDASLYECRGEGLILMTGSKQEVDSFVNTLRGESGMSGKALVGKGFALITESNTPAEQAKSDLGTGEIVPLD